MRLNNIARFALQQECVWDIIKAAAAAGFAIGFITGFAAGTIISMSI